MEMKELIGKTCNLHIKTDKKNLFYTAKIVNINSTHIYFMDKFNELYVFNINSVVEISKIG